MKIKLPVQIRSINSKFNLSIPVLSGIGIAFSFLFLASVLRAQNVTTYAGTVGVLGLVNGHKDTCQFNGVEQMAFDSHGNLFFADFSNQVIRKIDTRGNVITFAGTPSVTGFVNGYKDSCKFSGPLGIAIDKFDNIYVSDNYNHAIRKIDTAGNVTTFAGGSFGYTNGPGSIAQLGYPIYICFDDSMNLYVADNYNHAIRKIDSTGYVTTFAGAGMMGYADGNGENAYFSSPIAITYNSLQQAFYVVDRGFCFIRKITLQRDVTTIAGTGVCSFQNGPGNTAMLNEPKGITTDSIGNIYIAGRLDHTIRKIDLQNQVSTFAGIPDSIGYQDGPLATAVFNRPISLTISRNNELFISDVFNYVIRKIDSISYITTVPLNPVEISFDVFPNPTTGRFTILLPENGAEVSVRDMLGREVLKSKTTDRSIDLDLANNGLYIVYVKTKKGAATQKLVVNQ